METSTIESATTLKIVRNLPATQERVFEALVNRELLTKWMAPSDEFVTVIDRFEAEVGGSYRIDMKDKDGNVHSAVGKVLKIDAPNKLALTWRFEGGEMPDTLLTFELRTSESGTELTLIHERFPNQEATEKHLQGWIGCLDRLERLF